MIGSFSNIPYAKFALALGPVAMIGLIIAVALIAAPRLADYLGGRRQDYRRWARASQVPASQSSGFSQIGR